MEVSNLTELNQIIKENHNVLVILYTTWCIHCKKLRPIILEYQETHDNPLIVLANIDLAKEINEVYKVRVVPTLFFYQDQQILEHLDGDISYDDFITKVEEIY